MERKDNKMRRPIETLVGGREVEEELSVHSFHWVSELFLVSCF